MQYKKNNFIWKKKNFEEITNLKTSHTKEMADLKSSYENKLSQLKKTISELEDEIAKSKKKTGGIAVTSNLDPDMEKVKGRLLPDR